MARSRPPRAASRSVTGGRSKASGRSTLGGEAMLTYNDCLALSGLSQEEVSALARIKHLPEVVALEMGWSLCRTPQGKQVIRQMILDDIEAAWRRGDAAGAAKLG